MANSKIKTVNIPKTQVKVESAVDIIKVIESGMNKPTDNERSKKKITKGIYPYNF